MSKTVATFARIEGREVTDAFIKATQTRLQEYCQKKGYTIADSAMVIGKHDLGRKMLVTMIHSVKEKGIDTVVVETTSRYAYILSEMLEVQTALKDAGISLEATDGSEYFIESAEFLKSIIDSDKPQPATMQPASHIPS